MAHLRPGTPRLRKRFWMNLQAQYDLDTERDRLGGRLEREVVRRARTAVAEDDEAYEG